MTPDDLARQALRSRAARRLWPVLGAVVVAVAFVGYLTGLSPVDPPRRSPLAVAPAASDRAPRYPELATMRRGPNAAMYAEGLDPLRRGLPAPGASVHQTDDDRRAALAARAARRAYDGAPPTVPHEVNQQGIPDCLGCHEQGLRIGERTAPRISHNRHDNCLQCHVVAADPRPVAVTPPPPANAFVGLPAPSGGERAWAGAPPTMPHTTHMRTECSSCHGVTGPIGMRTTHPQRQSCTQCHAPSASLDQRPPAPLADAFRRNP